ncbi:hypothetical protein OQA88_8265 [Cercophora sp. LCS_1]
MARSTKDEYLCEGKIIRIILSNGYWAYRPILPVGAPPFQIPRPNPRPKQREQVTWSNPRGEWRASIYYFGKTSNDSRNVAQLEHRRIGVSEGCNYWAYDNSWDKNTPPPTERHRKKLERVKIRERHGLPVGCTRIVLPPTYGDATGLEVGEKKVEEKEVGVVLNARPRSATRLRDDPVENGKELAAAGDELPSDRWRLMDNVARPTDARVVVLSNEERELQDVINEIKIQDAVEDLSLDSIVHEHPLYSIKVVPKRRGRKNAREVKGKDVESVGSEPEISFRVEGLKETDNIDDIPWEGFLGELEAQGWVLMAGDPEDQDDSVSIAESWVLTPGEDID